MRVDYLATDNGEMEYVIDGDEVSILAYKGNDLELVIPEQILTYPVTKIAKKAFLSNKLLRTLFIPNTINVIGDWAFAHCASLCKIMVPYKRMDIGIGLVRECNMLKEITNSCSEWQDKKTEDIGYLLAGTLSLLQAPYLLDFENAGDADWLRKWDDRLRFQLRTDDEEGFTKMLLCGEEDYGSKENNKDYYMSEQRKKKVRLCLLRLMHDEGLSDELKEELQHYLKSYTKGCATDETWQVVFKEHGDDRRYFEFLIQEKCITKDNIQEILEEMGTLHTEMKSLLMQYRADWMDESAMFSEFDIALE